MDRVRELADAAPAGAKWPRSRRHPPLKLYLLGIVALVLAGGVANVAYQRSAAGDDARGAALADARFAAAGAAKDVGDALEELQTTVATTTATPGIEAVFDSDEPCQLAFTGAEPFGSGHFD